MFVLSWAFFIIIEISLLPDLPANQVIKPVFPVWQFPKEGVPAGADDDGAGGGLPAPQHAQAHPRPY